MGLPVQSKNSKIHDNSKYFAIKAMYYHYYYYYYKHIFFENNICICESKTTPGKGVVLIIITPNNFNNFYFNF